jgi:ribose transport system ATP-binding protein
MDEVILEGKGLSRDFSGVRVLFGVDIEGRRGEIHGIVGENGAGKSTLMNILAGILPPSEGRIIFRGKEVVLTPQLAKRLGIILVPQELNLVETLPVYENLFLGQEIRRQVFLDRRRMIERSREVLEILGIGELDPRTMVESLSTAQKQLVEIARVLLEQANVVIMDEPTATLTEHEIEALFRQLRRLRNEGTCVFYVSHRLREVKELCDRITVLRDGHLVTTSSADGLNEAEIARLMVGRPLDAFFPPKGERSNEVVLEVRNFSVENRVKEVTFRLFRGEVLGFAGLVGSGRTELAEGLVGLRRARGEVFFRGKRVAIRSPEMAKKLGMVYLPEERKSSGIIASLSVRENTTLMVMEKLAAPFIRHREEQRITQEAIERLSIRCKSPEEPIEFLSGGNQQKVVLARLMETKPWVCLLDEPTRGIDVNTKHYLYNLIRELAREGWSFLFISSDLPEVIGLCDRVAVMHEGELVTILEGADINEEEIIFHATGIKGRVGTYE